MSFLSSLVRTAAPVVAKVAPLTGTAGTVVGVVASQVERDTQRKKQKEQEEIRRQNMADFSDFARGSRGAVVVPPYTPPTTATSASGGFFSDVGQFFRDAGGVVRDAFSSGIPQLFGVGRTPSTIQQPAVSTGGNFGAQESQNAGSIQAFTGGLAPFIGAARNVLRNPIGQIGIGTGVGTGLSMLGGDGRQVRITRKTKRLAQQAYQLSLGDLSAATSLFANLSGMSVNEMQFVQILTKRFRNDGAVITKAALRKTKSTIRKMKNMCDMYDDLRPAARRRTPMRRASRSTTLIKN